MPRLASRDFIWKFWFIEKSKRIKLIHTLREYSVSLIDYEGNIYFMYHKL